MYIVGKNNILKKLSLITIILVLLVYTIAIITKPTEGYERSLYAMYPSVFWVFIGATIFLSILIIILSEYWEIQSFWIVSLISTLFVYSIFLLLPLIRGYYMNDWGDLPAHLSWAQYILKSGEINTYYPIAHIQLVILSYCGISLENASMIIPTIYIIVYILGLSILGRALQRGPWISSLPILFALPLLFGTRTISFSPQTLALCLVPLLYYGLFSTFKKCDKKNSYLIIIIIISLLIVFIHPLLTLILIILLFGFIATITIITCSNPDNNFRNILLQLLVILSITFCAWYLLYSNNFQIMFEEFAQSFMNSNFETTIAARQMDLIIKSNPSIFRFIEVFLKHNGSHFIYLSLGILCLLITINNVRLRQTSKMEILFSIQFLISMIIFFVVISGYFIIGNIERAMGQALVIVTIFIPIVLTKMIIKISSRKSKILIYTGIALTIIVVSYLSILLIFFSPWNYSQNDQLTYHDKSGYDWFLNYKNDIPKIIETENTYSHWLYEMYYLERSYGGKIEKYVDRYRQFLPLRTVYDEHNYLTETLPSGQYYYLSNEYSLPQKFIDSKEPEEQPYILFIRLKQDNSINLLYNNGEFQSWLIPVEYSH